MTPVLKRTFAYTKRKVRFAPKCSHFKRRLARPKADSAARALARGHLCCEACIPIMGASQTKRSSHGDDQFQLCDGDENRTIAKQT